MAEATMIPEGWEAVDEPLPEELGLARDPVPEGWEVVPEAELSMPQQPVPQTAMQPPQQRMAPPPAQQELPQPQAELPQQPAEPPKQEVPYNGKVYRFPHSYSRESIARWFNANVLAEGRELPKEKAGGRAQPWDSESEQNIRKTTPVTKQGMKEYAEFFSGVDDDGKPVKVKPEDITPQTLAQQVAIRKAYAEDFAKRRNLSPDMKRALKEFNEDTAAMERDWERKWPNETSWEYDARMGIAPEESAAQTEEGPTLGSRVLGFVEGGLRANPATYPAARAMHKWLNPEKEVDPEEGMSEEDKKILNSRPGYVARKNQPQEVVWAENMLREHQQRYGSEVPQNKKDLFYKANEVYDSWLKKNPGGADEGFDQWRKGKPFRSAAAEVASQKVDPYAEPRKDASNRGHFENVSEAMVARRAYGAGNVDLMAKWGLRRVPFAGRAVEAADMLSYRKAIKNAVAGKANDSDWWTIAAGLEFAENAKGRKGTTAGLAREVWDLASMLPAYGTEFAMTGGAAGAARTGARQLGVKLLGKSAMRNFVPRLAVQSAGFAASAAGRTALNVPLAASSIAEKWMPEYNLTRDEAGELAVAIGEDDPSFAEAVLKGYGSAYIEMASEEAGFVLGKGAKRFGKSEIGQSLAKLPPAQLLTATKAAITNFALRHKVPVETIKRIVKRAGYNGLIEEIAEERIGDIARGATGVADDYGTMGKLLEMDPEGWRQLGVEAASFAAIPIAMTAAGGAAAVMAPQETDVPERPRDELPPPLADASLEQLRGILSKKYVSAPEGRALRLPASSMANRGARKAAVENRIRELEQENQQQQEDQARAATTSEGVSEGSGQTVVEEADQDAATRDVLAAEREQATEATTTPDTNVSEQANVAAESEGREGVKDIAAELPEQLRPAFDSLPAKVIQDSPIKEITKSDTTSDADSVSDATVFYDKRTQQLRILDETSDEASLELQNEMIAAWAWENLSQEDYSAWRASVGRPDASVTGGTGGGMSNVDSFAQSAIDWMNGNPWGESASVFERIFSQPPVAPQTPVEPQTPSESPKAQETPPSAPQEQETAPDANLTQAVAKADQIFGHKVTPREPKTEDEREIADFMESRGKQFSFVDSEGASIVGMTDLETGFVLLLGDRETSDLWETVGHELAHESGLDKVIPADSVELAEAREDRLRRAKGKDLKRLEDDPGQLEREARADLVGRFLRDKDFRDELAREKPSLWERLRQAILKVVGQWNPSNEARAKVLDELRQAPKPKIGKKGYAKKTETGERGTEAKKVKPAEELHESGITLDEVRRITGLEEDTPALNSVKLPREGDPKVGDVLPGGQTVTQVWRTASSMKELDGVPHVTYTKPDGSTWNAVGKREVKDLLSPAPSTKKVGAKKEAKPAKPVRKPNRQAFTDAMVESGQMRQEDVGKKQFAFTFRDRMPQNRWLAANEISERMRNKEASNWVAKSMRPMVDAGLLDQMYRPDGTPVYAWKGTQPVGHLMDKEAADKFFAEHDAQGIARTDKIEPSVKKEAKPPATENAKKEATPAKETKPLGMTEDEFAKETKRVKVGKRYGVGNQGRRFAAVEVDGKRIDVIVRESNGDSEVTSVPEIRRLAYRKLESQIIKAEEPAKQQESPKPEAPPAPRSTPASRYLAEATDAELLETAKNLGISETDRDSIIKAIQSQPDVMAFIEENLPSEADMQLGRRTAASRFDPASLESAFVSLGHGGTNVTALPNGAGWAVHLPSGRILKVLSVRTQDVDVKSAVEARETREDKAQPNWLREIRRRQRELKLQRAVDLGMAGAAGVTVEAGVEVELSNGETVTTDDVTVLIDLDFADATTALHEPAHVMFRLGDELGYFDTPEGKKIRESLLKKYGTEEKVAEAREVWEGPQGLWEKIRDYLRRIWAKFGEMHPDVAMAKTFEEEFWSQERATSPRRSGRRAGRIEGEVAHGQPPTIMPSNSQYSRPSYQLKRVKKKVLVNKGVTQNRVYYVSFDPAVAAKMKDRQAKNPVTSLTQARQVNASPVRVKDWQKIYADAPRYGKPADVFKQPAKAGKLVGVEVLQLTKGCQRSLATVERVANGVLPNETRIEACYGGDCWVNSTIPVLFKTKENMEARDLSLADPAMFEKLLTPKRVARLNKTVFLREGYSGDSSHLFATDVALEWLKAAKKAGVKRKTVFISAAYAPVTDAQYEALKPYNDLLEIHFSISGWFHRSEIMIRLAEYKAAKKAGLDAHLRIITNANNLGNAHMENQAFLDKQLAKMGIKQEDVLETPYHNDDLPATVRKKYPERWRSDPSGDWLNICCETHACKSCKRKCMTGKVEVSPAASYQLKPKHLNADSPAEPSYQLKGPKIQKGETLAQVLDRTELTVSQKALWNVLQPILESQTKGMPSLAVVDEIERGGVQGIGEYEPMSHAIQVIPSAGAHALLHEAVHAATRNAALMHSAPYYGGDRAKKVPARSREAYSRLEQIANWVQAELAKAGQLRRDVGLPKSGNINAVEVIAEAFTRPQFQEFLADRKVPRSTKFADLRGKNLLEAFIDTVKRLLGIGKGGRAVTALEEVMGLTDTIMQEDVAASNRNTLYQLKGPKVDPDTVSKEVLSKMSRTLKAKGYDVRGAGDILNLWKEGRVTNADGELWQEDWIEAYNKATGSAVARKAKIGAKKKETPHVNWQRLKELGTTTDLREAGYIKPDGSLQDLSGKTEGGPAGARAYDHREAGGTPGMQEIMGYGWIRMDDNAGMVDIAKMPTSQQLSVIRRMAENHNGDIAVSLDDGLGEWDEGRENYNDPERSWYGLYPDGTKPARIVNDIKKFYAGEEPPQPRAVAYQLRAPNTPEFQKWFGDSKVVDENGDPLLVYHGTKSDISEFKRSQGGEFGSGIYFAPRKSTAEMFGSFQSGSEPVQVLSVYLSMQNPLVTNDRNVPRGRGIKKLIKQGYDGIIGTTPNGDVQYVVFDPTQIKSATDNVGSYDSTNPDIRYQLKPGQNRMEALNEFLKQRKQKEEAAKKQKSPGEEPPAAEAPQGPVDTPLTGIANEVQNELRRLRGVGELEGVDPETTQQWLDAAVAAISHDRTIGERLVAEQLRSPRNLSEREVAILQHHYRELNNSFEQASNALFQAVESGDSVAIAMNQSHAEEASKLLIRAEEAAKAAGREWGRAGVARQILLAKDFSLAGMTRKARVANGGKDLSAEQQAEIAKMAKQIEALEKQLAEEQAKNVELERQAKLDEQIRADQKDVKIKRTRKKSNRQKEAADRRKAALSKFAEKWAALGHVGFAYDPKQEAAKQAEALAAAAEVVKAFANEGYVAFTEFWSSIKGNIKTDAEQAKGVFQEAWNQAKDAGEIDTPELDFNDLAGITRVARQIQRALVESGVTEREEVVDGVHEAIQELAPDITRRQTMDALSGYGQFSPLSKDQVSQIIRDINGQLQQVAKIDDLENALKLVEEWRKEGVSEDEIDSRLVERDLLPKKTGPERRTPSDIERQLIQKVNELKKSVPVSSTTREGQLKSAQEALETSLRNRISDVKWEIEHQERIVRERRKTPDNKRIEALRSELEELRKIHREMFPPQRKQMTEEQRVAAAMRAADRAIAQLEEQLKTGNVGPPAKAAPLSSPELDARNARLKHLRAQRDALRAATMPELAEQYARASYIGNLRKRIADYSQRIAKEDFDPRPKRGPRKLSSTELGLKRQLEDVKHDFFEKAAEYHLANMSKLERGWDAAKETAHLSRALMTSFDLSATYRQGGLVVMGHPGLAKQAGEEMLKALVSHQAEFASIENIRNRPNGQLYNTSGLDITSDNDKLTRQEEAYMGRWAKKVPGVAASGRAYVTFLNNLRADLFDQMVENLGRNGQVTLDEAKVIARFVNVATGRADLKAMNTAAANLNMVFFAPRYVASRFQYMAMPFYLPFTKTSTRVKVAIAKEYARTFAGTAAFMGIAVALGSLLAGDDDDKPTVEFNPLSADFMKIRFGETRIDPMAGLSQAIVLSSRMIAGHTKSSTTGKVRKFGEGYKPETRMTTLGRFFRTKLAPVPGAVATSLNDWENVVGEEETPASIAASLFLPLSMREVYDTMRNRGIPQGTALSVLGIMGMSLNTYGPKTEYMAGTPKERNEQFEKDLENMEWNSDSPAYAEFLTQKQMTQVDNKRDEKKQLALINGLKPDPEREANDTDTSFQKKVDSLQEKRDKMQEMLQSLSLSHEDAQQLLLEYYRRPGDDGLPRTTEKGSIQTEQNASGSDVDESYRKAAVALAELYGNSDPEKAWKDFYLSPDLKEWRRKWNRETAAKLKK
jgi:hypothetical protein